LVECIAPTKSDIRRFALFEQQHSNNNNSGNILFDKDEQFVIEVKTIFLIKLNNLIYLLIFSYQKLNVYVRNLL